MTALRITGGVALCALLAGCSDGAELAALQARLSRDEALLAEKQTIAQNLGEYRREMELAQKKIAAANVPQTWDASDAMVRVNRAASGAVQAFEPNEKGAHVVLGGANGPEQLALAITGVQAQLPTAWVRRVEVHDRAWKVELDLDQPDAVAPPASAAPGTPPLPPETWRSGEESKRLRERISQTERRIAELDKVIGEVQHLTEAKQRLERILVALEDPGRAKRALPLVSSVIDARPALLEDGVATFADGAIRVQVARGRKAAEWGDALAGKVKVVAYSEGPPATVELAPVTAK